MLLCYLPLPFLALGSSGDRFPAGGGGGAGKAASAAVTSASGVVMCGAARSYSQPSIIRCSPPPPAQSTPFAAQLGSTCPQAGWVSMLLLEWLRNAARPPGSRTRTSPRSRSQPSRSSGFNLTARSKSRLARVSSSRVRAGGSRPGKHAGGTVSRGGSGGRVWSESTLRLPAKNVYRVVPSKEVSGGLSAEGEHKKRGKHGKHTKHGKHSTHSTHTRTTSTQAVHGGPRPSPARLHSTVPSRTAEACVGAVGQ